MRRTIASAILAALLVQPAAVLSGEAAATPATGGVSWEKDFKTALKRAKESGKPVMVDFWAEWCEWCHKLDATTYRDAGVLELARDFVAVKVDTEGTPAEAELTARYGVGTLPTIGFLSPSGRLFLRRSGFEGPERFPATLDEARGLAREVVAFETALALDKKDTAALAGLGALLGDRKLHAESLELLRDARKADQARPPQERKRTRRLLALAERARKKRGDAVRLLEEALALQPAEPGEDAASLLALGEVYVEQSRPEQARRAWQRTLEIAPEGELARLAGEALAKLPAR